MSKKYLYRVTVTVAQTFAVLAESESSARAMAMDDDAWHHLEDIGTDGDISARVDGNATFAEPLYWLGAYRDDGLKCGTCHAALEYGTGNDYTCECEEVPSE